MKIIRVLIFVIVTLFFNSCDPEYVWKKSEAVFLCLNNCLADTVNINLIFHTVDLKYPEENIDENVKIDSILPSSEVIIGRFSYNSNSICDTFKSTIVDLIQEKKLTIIALSGDTLVSWNDNSVVFTDKQYWIIETKNMGFTDIDLKCTLNLTDEVLKLK